MEIFRQKRYCIFLLFTTFSTVLCASERTQEYAEDNIDKNFQKPDAERKAIPLHKNLPDQVDVPLPDPTTGAPTSKLTTDHVVILDPTIGAPTSELTGEVAVPDPTTGATSTTSKLTTSPRSDSVTNFTTTHATSSFITTSNASAPTSSSAPTFHPITAPPSNETCQNLLEFYATLSSNFTNCAIVHAKPFLFCENCVKEYVKTLDAYKQITDDETKCRDTLLASDTVQIVNQLHNFVLALWDDGKCDFCFEDVDECRSNQTCSLSVDTRHFMASYKDTMDCFNMFSKHRENGSDIADVCTNCSDVYRKLTESYENTGSLDETCMDIVELMNHTRITWSKEYNCTYFKKDIGSVVAIGCFIGTLPLFFYCAVRVHAEKQERKFMRQKRLSYATPQSANIQYRSTSTTS